MQIETLEELASARRYAYAAFQRFMGNEPTLELFKALDLDILRMAFEVVGALPEAEELVGNMIEQLAAAPDNLDQIADDYARIFVGPAALPAPPWESVYRDHKRMLMTATTLSVREYYRAYGYEAQRKHHVPDDHLAIELDFLSAMSQETLDACSAARISPSHMQITKSETNQLRKTAVQRGKACNPYSGLHAFPLCTREVTRLQRAPRL